MAVAVAIQIIAITSNLTADTQRYYLPICTGKGTSGSAVNITGGGVVFLGYNHLGESATGLASETSLTTPEPYPTETALFGSTREPTGNEPTFSRRTTAKVWHTQKPKQRKRWWQFWKWGRRRRSVDIPSREQISQPTTQHSSFLSQSLWGSRADTQSEQKRGSPEHQSDTHNQQRQVIPKLGPSKQSHPHSRLWPQLVFNSKRTRSATLRRMTAQQNLKSFFTKRRTQRPKVPRGAQVSPTTQSVIKNWGSQTSAHSPDANLYSLSSEDHTALLLRARRSTMTQTDGDDWTCGCDISATSEFYVMVVPLVLPDSFQPDTAVLVKAANVSKKLSIFEKDLQFHVFANTSESREESRRKRNQETGSSVDEEDTERDVVSAHVFLTSSGNTTSFMVALAVMSYGDIAVSCNKEHKTEGEDNRSGGATDTVSNDRQIATELGSPSVGGEMIAGIVLIVLAILIVGAAVVWYMYRRTQGGKLGNKSVEREGGESLPMKELCTYEGVEDGDTGYYRYSDPLDHRTTVMTSSQTALDRAHIILHHPELGSAAAAPTTSGAQGKMKVKAKTPTSTVPGPSRHLAELAVTNVKVEEDAVSDVYEEYSTMIVQDEEQEKLDRAEALQRMVETQRSMHGDQQSSLTKQMSQLEQPVVIRVHRKESDTKKHNSGTPKSPTYSNQRSIDESTIEANDIMVNTACTPLTSKHERKPSDECVDLTDSIDQTRPQGKQRELRGGNINISFSEQDDIDEYINTKDLHSQIKNEAGDCEQITSIAKEDTTIACKEEFARSEQFDLNDSVPQGWSVAKSCGSEPESKNSPDFTAQGQSPRPHEGPELQTYGLASAKPLVEGTKGCSSESGLETYGLASGKPLVGENTAPQPDFILETYGLASGKPLFDGSIDCNNESSLETYGLASGKPLVSEYSVSQPDSILETYGLASAKPLVGAVPFSETYGLASGKPLVGGTEVDNDECSLETYGLASGKPLFGENTASQPNSILQTYGLASGKPLDIDNTNLNEKSDVETYGLASAKSLTTINSASITDTGLETYGLSSGKPLHRIQPSDNHKLETYGLASAKLLDSQQSETARDLRSSSDKTGAGHENQDHVVGNTYAHLNEKTGNVGQDHVFTKEGGLPEKSSPVEVIRLDQIVTHGNSLSMNSSAMKQTTKQSSTLPSPVDVPGQANRNQKTWESLEREPGKEIQGYEFDGSGEQSSTYEIVEENIYGNLSTLQQDTMGAVTREHDAPFSGPKQDQCGKTLKDLNQEANYGDHEYESYSDLRN